MNKYQRDRSFFRFTLILLLTIPSSTSILSQPSPDGTIEWAPIGATWSYIYYIGVTEPNNRIYTMTSVLDTIIAGISAKKLTGVVEDYTEGADMIFPDQFISQVGDSILYYNNQISSFSLLYNMAAQIGDTIEILVPETSDIVMQLVVTSTDSIIVGTETLRRLNLREAEPYSGLFFDGDIVEKMGSVNHFFFPANLFAQESIFCNYVDSALQIDFNEAQCNLALSTSNVAINDITLFPNPARQTIKIISSDPGPHRVLVFDLLQRPVLEQGTYEEIDMSILTTGTYFVHIRTGHYSSTFKIMKL